MRYLVALGGNALAPAAGTSETAAEMLRSGCRALVPLLREHQVVVTHGNGPQVGRLAEVAAAADDRTPLDVLGAESAGQIGYLLEQELTGVAPDLDVVSLLTRVVVRPDDPAFAQPTKPIGPYYSRHHALELEATRGWTLHERPAGWRRVVPSPEPLAIIEARPIRVLLEAGVTVICDGGGGIPVVREQQRLRGVEAVVDKDLSSALLARLLQVDVLVLLTDVDAVVDGWGTDAARPIRRTTPAALRTRTFEAGSMGPKVEAACRFVEGGGRHALVGALVDIAEVVAGRAGTRVEPGHGPAMDFWA